MAAHKIKLYTNHNCPWAHRAHIALAELDIPYEEEIIDLAVPRTQSYLAVNPRGLVPTLSYDGEIIAESGVVAQFLADAHPSHLVPASAEPGGALRRARINFFVDTYISKVLPAAYRLQLADGPRERAAAAEDFAAAVVGELEPLLGDAAPFFGGSQRLTLAEVQTGSFIVRLLELPRHGLYPELVAGLPEKAPRFWKWAEAVAAHPSVRKVFDGEAVAAITKMRFEKMKAEKEKEKV